MNLAIQNPLTFTVPWADRYEFANSVLGTLRPGRDVKDWDVTLPAVHPDDDRYRACAVDIAPVGNYACVQVGYSVPELAPF